MTLLEAVKASNKECLIITDRHTQQALLKALSSLKVFKAMRFMNKQDLFNEVFFKLDDKAIFLASHHLNLKPAIIESLLPFLPLIDCSSSYPTKRLNQLKDLKVFLEENHKLHYPQQQAFLFEDKDVFVDLPYDPLLEGALKRLSKYTNYTRIKKPPHANEKLYKGVFPHINEELATVAHTIRTLLETKRSNTVKVVMLNENYRPILKHIFLAFEIPHYFNDAQTLLHFEETKRVLKALDKCEEAPFYHQLSKVLSALKPEPHEPERLRIFTKLIQTLNPFVQEDQSYKLLKEELLFTLNQTRIQSLNARQGIEVTSSISLSKDAHTVFVLGCAESYFPSLQTEDDFLNPHEKTLIDYPKANTINHHIKASWFEFLESYPEVYLSFSHTGITEQYFESPFFQDIEDRYQVIPYQKVQRKTSHYGELYDKISTKKHLDNYNQYHEDHEDLNAHYEQFQKAYVPFDNRFSALSQTTIDDLIKTPHHLSYTKLNTYFKCKFRYLMEHVFKLSSSQESLAIDLGVFFHDVLEHYIHQEVLTKDMLETTLEKVLLKQGSTITKRERFFLMNSYTLLMDVFKTIKHQHHQSNYTLSQTELKIEKVYAMPKEVRFSGVIDTLFIREHANQKHIILLDYKTGQTMLKLKESYYGLNCQLVFYALLLEEALKTSHQITGLYEQTILPKPFKNKDQSSKEALLLDSLKWKGYTLKDEEEILQMDRGAFEEPFIEGMRFKKDGTLDARVKTFEKEDLSLLKRHLEHLIETAIHQILKGDFSINPKRDLKGNDLSCQYCQFKDICYKKIEDYETLDVPKDDAALFKRLKEDDYGKH